MSDNLKEYLRQQLFKNMYEFYKAFDLWPN
jgi:hypothetical protein